MSILNTINRETLHTIANFIDWTEVCKESLEIDFILEFMEYIDWAELSKQSLTDEIIKQFAEYLDWDEISKTPLSEDFIRAYASWVDWETISLYQRTLTDDFIHEFDNRIDWETLCRTGNVSEDIIRAYPDDVDWWILSHAAPSEEFIREYADRYNWNEFVGWGVAVDVFSCAVESAIAPTIDLVRNRRTFYLRAKHYQIHSLKKMQIESIGNLSHDIKPYHHTMLRSSVIDLIGRRLEVHRDT